MDSLNTREKIRKTALELFSQRGYSAVSIRDIGKIVGIKESSIYYHFKNKQDIFQSLLDEVRALTGYKKQVFNEHLEKSTGVEEEAFIQVGINFLENYLLNAHIHPFICMLEIEQHVNEEAALLYHELLFETPVSYNTAVFMQMIEKAYFKRDDPVRLANEYCGMVFFIFSKFFSNGEITEDGRKAARDELAVHLKTFYNRYKIN